MAFCRVNYTYLQKSHLQYEVHITVLSFNVTFLEQTVSFLFLHKKVYTYYNNYCKLLSKTLVLGILFAIYVPFYTQFK
jgi:hypothetical protein